MRTTMPGESLPVTSDLESKRNPKPTFAPNNLSFWGLYQEIKNKEPWIGWLKGFRV